jgi:hypothetical protein
MLACRSLASQTRTIASRTPPARALEDFGTSRRTGGRVRIDSNVCSIFHAGTPRMA